MFVKTGIIVNSVDLLVSVLIEFVDEVNVVRILDSDVLSLACQFHLLCTFVDDKEIFHVDVGIDGGGAA